MTSIVMVLNSNSKMLFLKIVKIRLLVTISIATDRSNVGIAV